MTPSRSSLLSIFTSRTGRTTPHTTRPGSPGKTDGILERPGRFDERAGYPEVAVMHTEMIEDLKITVTLPKKVLENLDKAGYLDTYTSCHTNLTIRSYRSRSTLNKTIRDMIIREWG